MNAKQALKAVSQRLSEVEIVLARAQSDINQYNLCIDSMISGGSPCEYCEEEEACQLQAKTDGKGCAQWWLKYQREEEPTGSESERILPAGGDSGKAAENPAGEIQAF